MKTLYFNLKNGISGDMAVAALLDLGADEKYLHGGLARLNIGHEFSVCISKINKNGIIATDFSVNLHEHQHEHNHSHGRNFRDIKELIINAQYPSEVEEMAIGIFNRIAVAESQVHGVGIDNVHFHEAGAVDSVVNVVATALCIYNLKPDRIIASPVNTGSGTVRCDHGIFPVPAPATAKILVGIPAFSNGVPYELTTPTGAGIIAYLADKFGDMPVMTITGVGYGAGRRELDYSNCLQVIMGEEQKVKHDVITCIQTNIDDVSGEVCGYLLERLMDNGALDCYYTPIIMKKSRPAYMLTVLCKCSDEERLEDIIFTEIPTLGVRKTIVNRDILSRDIRNVDGVKVKTWDYNGLRVSAECEDCKLRAMEKGISLKSCMGEVEKNALESMGKNALST